MSKKHHPGNERVKRKYLEFMKNARQHSEGSLDTIAMAIARFEEYTKWRDFKAFHHKQAVGFKAYLARQKSQKTGKPLSKTTLYSTVRHLKAFFEWLSREPGYKSRIHYSDAEYFNLSAKDTRVATAKRAGPVPTIEQIKHVLNTMPFTNDIEKRDRALVAFTLLTGTRNSATISMKIKHIDIHQNCVSQDAREVNTKFSKTFATFFFPVDKDVYDIVHKWVCHLKGNLLFGNDDPLFPKTLVAQGQSHSFQASGLSKDHWSNAGPVRRIFRRAFETAGFGYYQPHSFRHTLAQLGERVCRTPEQFKAWSQNLGHESTMTTFSSYGEVQEHRQGELMRGLRTPRASTASGTEGLDELSAVDWTL